MTKANEPGEDMVSEGAPASPEAAELDAATKQFEDARAAAEPPKREPDGVTVPFQVEAPAPGTPMMPVEIYSGQVGEWLDKLRELLKAKGHEVSDEGPLLQADATAIEAQLAQAGRDVRSAFHLGLEDWKALWRSLL